MVQVVVVFVTMCCPAKRGVASGGRKTVGVAARGAARWRVGQLGLGPGCQLQVPKRRAPGKPKLSTQVLRGVRGTRRECAC